MRKSRLCSCRFVPCDDEHLLNEWAGGTIAQESFCEEQEPGQWSIIGQPHERAQGAVGVLVAARHLSSSPQLFQRTATQFDKLRSRNAFLDHYQKHEVFRDSLAEFDDSRAVVADLIEEYQAAAKDDYLQWAQARASKK